MRRKPLLISLIGILVIAYGSLVANLIAGNSPQLGLDLQGGASVTLQPVGEFDDESLDVVADIYRSRVDSLGVAEPEILRQGDTIVVNLPGVKDKDRAIELIGTTGKVVFRPVLSQLGPLQEPIDMSAIPETSPSTTTAPVTTVAGATTSTAPPTTAAEATTSTAQSSGFLRPRTATTEATATTAATDTTIGIVPISGDQTTTTAAPTDSTAAPLDLAALITPTSEDVPEAQVTLPSPDGLTIYNLGPAFALGETAIEGAQPRLSNGEWVVELTLTSGADGLGAWNEMATTCYNRQPECAGGGMAIVLDHRVISAPAPQTPFFDSPTVLISGGGSGFSETEASDLAKVLQYGSTPVEMQAQAAQTVSPTLGKDSLRAGLISGAIGILLVLAFMFFYYGSLAIVMAAGLTVSASILWSVISILSRTSGLALTLAGVTGIIVSVGVTVDSYVVFFERLKDEVQSGKTLRSSAQRGFKSAWRTILAADTVSLIGAGVLWYLSVGSVRGFAFFLGLSTLCDMVVAYFFTRPAVLLLSRSKRFQRGRVLGVQLPAPTTVPVGGAA